MECTGLEFQGWGGDREASAVVQVEDKECLETGVQEVRQAGQGVWKKKGEEGKRGRGPYESSPSAGAEGQERGTR